VAQTTAELLADYLARQLIERMGTGLKTATLVRMEVEENFGQLAVCEISP
jgi:hypothetical protein